MENASKALIIAGSIIVAIMIVALGVKIFNGAKNSADTTSLDSAEITMFNQKFERFAGTQSGSNVKSLISFAISNASTNKEEVRKLPTISCGTDTATCSSTAEIDDYISNLSTIRQDIKSTSSYEVKLTYSKNALVEEITINDPN